MPKKLMQPIALRAWVWWSGGKYLNLQAGI